MAKEISPENQSIDTLFSSTTYYIDFYQRDYKWTTEPVKRLLDDIFYLFDAAYSNTAKQGVSPEIATDKYPWYYLNSYVTNTIDGKVYVVDGQQRLTTITLILMNLRQRANTYESELAHWISNKIAGQSGYKTKFWMNHERHKAAMKALFDNSDVIPTKSGISAENMETNYKAIDRYLHDKLDTKHKFETFVFYFLNRLVLINLSVNQTDVPMVFEVINDRGVRLRPYEILKGKLLGQIDKTEMIIEDYNSVWENGVARVNQHKPEEIDPFFVYYLKAKYADNRKQGQRFDNEYHREMFHSDINEKIDLERNPKSVKLFLKNEFEYYTKVYSKIWNFATTQTQGFDHVYFNRLNEMDSQFLLILSACSVDDRYEDEKIKLISFNIDRLFSLLRLQRAYDSNEFSEAIFEISKQIRNGEFSKIQKIFDDTLQNLLISRRGSDISKLFEFTQFKNTSINDIPTRFTRYFFARVDNFIAKNVNMENKHPIADLVLKTGAINGFHIEHILSRNDANLALYNNDEDTFEIDRNRLGAILMLKGKDNISSGNEPFSKKLESYANTLHWNETLRSDSYKSKKDFSALIERSGLQFKPYSQFADEQVEARQELLFGIAQKIWEPNWDEVIE